MLRIVQRVAGARLPFMVLVIALAAVIAGPRLESFAGRASAASLQTRAFSCPGNGFYPRFSDTPYFDEDLVARGTSEDDWFYCAATLPNKAVVKKVQFTVRDSSANHQFQYCGLIRVSLVALDHAAVLSMAQVTTPSAAAAPGFVRASTSSVSGATIDNGKYSYYLQCKFTFGSGTVDSLSLIGGNVIYSISAANG